MARSRQSCCSFGHPFSPANVRLNGKGSQECVVCARRRSRDWARRHRAALRTVDDKQPPTIALVVWRLIRQPGALGEYHTSWTYHRTDEDAAAQAPGDGTPFSIVNVARKP